MASAAGASWRWPAADRARTRRKGSRCSTARSSRPPGRWRPCLMRSVCFRARSCRGALSTDAARGSDAPFDPRIHALRGHRGQIEVAEALRALMNGSAIRASHLIGDERVQDPYCLRCQPQVMGAALDILRNAAATLAQRGEWRHRQSADLCRRRHGFVWRQFSRRARSFRGRHDGARDLPRSARWRSGASRCWSIPRCPACRLF